MMTEMKKHTELLDRWNREDDEGSIQPPLTIEEVETLARHGVYPETDLSFHDLSTGVTHESVARKALMNCRHIRAPGRPDITAEALSDSIVKK